MASYRYNVIIDVAINTAKASAGKGQVASAFTEMEQAAAASGAKMTAQAGVDADKMAGVYHELYKGRVADEKRVTREQESEAGQRLRIQEKGVDQLLNNAKQYYDQRNAFHAANAKAEQKIVDESLAYQIARVKENTAKNAQIQTDAQRQTLAIQKAGAAEVQKLNQQIAKADPFQKNQNTSLSQAGKDLSVFQKLETDVNRFNQSIKSLDPFQGQKFVPFNKVLGELDAHLESNTKKANAFTNSVANLNKQIGRSDPFQTQTSTPANQVIGKIQAFNQTQRQIDERNVNPFANLSNGLNKLDKDLDKNQRSMGIWGQAFKGAFIGAFVGTVFSTIVGSITGFISKVEELVVSSVQLAAKFELTRNAMTLFTGSARGARDEIATLDELARNTPGLRMEDAEQGAVRLRALGFEAATVQNLVVGISKQKLISGVSDEGAVQRVIVNLQQLRAGSPQIQRDIQQMVLSIPSLSIEITKAFGSIDKFKKALREDPEKALDKFAKQMASAQVPAAGLSDAIGKTEDAFIEAQRRFGEPFLEPLTRDAKELTQYLRENGDTWASWGSRVINVIQGAVNLWKEFHSLVGSTPPPKGSDAEKYPITSGQNTLVPAGFAAGGAAIGAGVGAFFAGVGAIPGAAIGGGIGTGVGLVATYLEGLGEQEAKQIQEFKDIANAAKAKYLAKSLGLPASAVGINLEESQPDPNSFKAFEDIRKASLAEKARVEQVADNKAFHDRDAQLLKDSFSIQEKALDTHHRYTLTEERKFQQDVFRLKQSQLRQEFQFQNKYFDDQEKLADGDKKEIQAINIDRAKTLSAINAQIAGNALEWEKRQSELAAQEQEQRRQSAIKNAELTSQGLTDALSRRNSAIERSLTAGTLSYEASYEREIEIANQAEQVLLNGIKERLKLELENRALTEDEKRNLRTEAYQEELKAEEDQIEKIFGIQQRRLDRQRVLIEQNTSVFIQSITTEAEALAGTLDLLFNDRSFSAGSANLLRQLKNVIGLQLNDINDELIQYYDIRKTLDALDRKPTAVVIAPVQTAPPVPQQKRFLSPADVPQLPRQESVVIDATTGQTIADPTIQETLNRIGAQPTGAGTLRGLAKTPPQFQYPTGSQLFKVGGDSQQQEVIATPLSAVPIEKFESDSIKRRSVIDEEITHLTASKEILEDFFKSVKAAYDAFVPTAEGVDKFRADNLKIKQDAESTALQKQIDQQQKLVELQKEVSDNRIKDLTKSGLSPEQIAAELKAQQLEGLPERQKLDKLQGDQRLLEITHLKESNDLYQQSIAGIKGYNDALAAGDPVATAFAENRAVTGRLNAEGQAMEKIIALQDRLKNGGTLDFLEIEAAKLSDIVELRHQEVAAVISINRSQAELANKTVYSATQSDAKVLEFLRSQKGITDIISDAKINLISTAYGQLDSVIGRLTAKMGAFGNVVKDLLSNLIKLALNSIFQKLFTGTTPGGGLFGGGQRQGQTGGGGGGLFGGIGNIFGGGQRQGGFGGIGPGGTPFFNPNITGGGNAGIGYGGVLGSNPTNQQIAQNLLGKAANVDTERLLGQGGPAPGLPAFSLSGSLTQSLALAAPTVGFGIGSAIGGGSGLSGILGGIGGLALGGAAGVALLGGASAGIFASATATTAAGSLAALGPAAAFLTNPFTIAAGAAILIGAYFLNRNKVRRKEEGIRSEALISAEKALDKLIEGVRNDTVDGAGALQQADQIREQYVAEMKQLKDGKTRRIALKDVSRLDLKIAKLKEAVTQQVSRKERLELIVPTFATGGVANSEVIRVSRGETLIHPALAGRMDFSNTGIPGFGGGGNAKRSAFFRKVYQHFHPERVHAQPAMVQVPGAFDRRDDVLMNVPRGTVIATPTQMDRVNSLNQSTLSYYDMRKNLPVRKFATGGVATGSGSPLSSESAEAGASGSGPMTLELSLNVGISAESFVEIANATIRNANGSTEQLNAIVKALKDQGSTELARVLAKQIGPMLDNK